MNSAWSRPHVVSSPPPNAAEEAEPVGLVEPRAGEAGRRGPGERAAGVLAAADVEGAVDDDVELEAGAGAELEHAHAALDAVAERDQPDPGGLLQAADPARELGARVAPARGAQASSLDGRGAASPGAPRRTIEYPPSTTSVWPVTKPASALQSRTTARAMSSGSAQRPAGVRSTTSCSTMPPSAIAALDHRRAHRAGQERVHADAATGPLDPEHAGQADDACLARAVRVPGPACRPAAPMIDATLTMQPRPAASMRAPNARQHRYTPVRLTSRTSVQSSSVNDSAGPILLTPGAVDEHRRLAETLGDRCRGGVHGRRSSGRRARTPRAPGPSSAASPLRPPAASWCVTATRAPASASARAIAAPIPCRAPVTTATSPSSEPIGA